MEQISNVGETTLLNGRPLALVTREGVRTWIENGVGYSYRYDRVQDPISGKSKYRRLYAKDGTGNLFVLMGECGGEAGMGVILFDREPDKDGLDVKTRWN